MEDIGGSEGESRHRRDDIDSGLLNLLDGVGIAFKLPTFIIATTNFPENLLQSLADRPGRFDLMMELKSPSYEEKLSLIEFIAKRALSDDEKDALKRKEVSDFSIAHLEEIVVRSMLHDKEFVDVINEMVQHTEKFKNSFEERKSLGLGIGR
jgi:ATP-dependent 26S proteasome regulatory subunit